MAKGEFDDDWLAEGGRDVSTSTMSRCRTLRGTVQRNENYGLNDAHILNKAVTYYA